MTIFSERLRALRQEKGLNQVDLAQVLGVSAQSYSAYEMGREPKYDALTKLADYFDCTTDYLLGLDSFRRRDERVAYDDDIAYILRALEEYPEDVRATFLDIFRYLTLESYAYLEQNKELQSNFFHDMTRVISTLSFTAKSMGLLSKRISLTPNYDVYKLSALCEIADTNIARAECLALTSRIFDNLLKFLAPFDTSFEEEVLNREINRAWSKLFEDDPLIKED